MENKIRVVVVAIIKNKDKYLLTKRYEPKRLLTHETWQLPGGGLKFNETANECLVREIREELGVEIETISQPIVVDNIVKEENWHGVTLAYICRLQDKNAKIILNHEATEYKWLSYEESKTYRLHFGTLEMLAEAEKLKKE
jgi:ADP-ribose pyrophosphatase YjhB (NUDIX family)